jgi:hypothetical protein
VGEQGDVAQSHQLSPRRTRELDPFRLASEGISGFFWGNAHRARCDRRLCFVRGARGNCIPPMPPSRSTPERSEGARPLSPPCKPPASVKPCRFVGEQGALHRPPSSPREAPRSEAKGTPLLRSSQAEMDFVRGARGNCISPYAPLTTPYHPLASRPRAGLLSMPMKWAASLERLSGCHDAAGPRVCDGMGGCG